MAFASLTDVNTHLPEDKYLATDVTIVNPGIDADRLIRARLGNIVDVSVMDAWTDPTLTPELVRKISGLLVAATLYAEAVAEDYEDGSPYAQSLYDQAMAELNNILSGVDVIIGVDGNPIETDVESDLSFFPDFTTSPTFAVSDSWS